MLLTNDKLRLGTSQRKAIIAIAAQWSTDKQRLLSAMKPLAPSQGRMDQVQGQLMDYSLLSRQYNEARETHWSQALKVLSASQQRLVTP